MKNFYKLKLISNKIKIKNYNKLNDNYHKKNNKMQKNHIQKNRLGN